MTMYKEERKLEIESRINKLHDALDIVTELETGDSRELKKSMRAELCELEDELELMFQ